MKHSLELALAYALVIPGMLSCKELTARPGLPAGTPNPSFYNDPEGARGMRNAAMLVFETALAQYILDAGLLTDELEDGQTGASPGLLLQSQGTVLDPLDERLLPEGAFGGVASYNDLQEVRAYSNQAIRALAMYDTVAVDQATSKMLRGELYALEGYAEIMLADFFCSGVPLSTLDFQRDFTYHASSTTAQVYDDAIAKFDTALTLADTSIEVLNAARVGQGRAYLQLGQFAAAAEDVATVPDGFQYNLAIPLGRRFSNNGIDVLNDVATISDHEGRNGLVYRSSGDPRTAYTVVATTDGNGNTLPTPLTFPVKYGAALGSSGYTPFTMANAIEARLIQAEAALHGVTTETGDWLTQLNRLRTTGVQTTVTVPDTVVDTLGYTGCTAVDACDANGFATSIDYNSLVLVSSTTLDLSAVDVTGGIVDVCRANNPNRNFGCAQPTLNVYVDPAHTHTLTTWPAGTGGVVGLPPLSDPGTPAGQVQLLFQERAYWLFISGHRQGDLRRLLRQYGTYAAFSDQTQVYPSGIYLAPGAGQYGTDVTVPIPSTEYANPLYHGCLTRAP